MPGPAAAIIAAAGSGRRASGASPEAKQFLWLAGRPLFAWGLRALADAGCAPIVVVVPQDRVVEVQPMMPEGIDVAVVPGGVTRQESVARGLEKIVSPHVVVHDAARPFITTELVRRVLDGLATADAAVAAVPVADTLKRAERRDPEKAYVSETVDRSDLWQAQTPAAFATPVLARAHELAQRDGFVATDDAQLVEHYGLGSVLLVAGSRTNIKVTYEEDLLLAAALAERLA